jgi:hypothetical protein
MAAWHGLDAVPGLNRVPMVDIGLRLWRERPAADRHEPAPGTPPLPGQMNTE